MLTVKTTHEISPTPVKVATLDEALRVLGDWAAKIGSTSDVAFWLEGRNSTGESVCVEGDFFRFDALKVRKWFEYPDIF